MGTFAGNTIVALAGGKKIGMENDNTLPDSGALTWKSANTPTDLQSTTGVDCKLVHGDRWQEILGSMTEHFTGSVTSNIDTDNHLTVKGLRTVDITGSFTENYYSTYKQDVWQTVLIHYHAAATTMVDGLANLAQSSPAFTWNGPAQYQNFGFQWLFVGNQIQLLTTALNLVPLVQINAITLAVGVVGVGVDIQGVAIQAHGTDLTLKQAVQKIVLAYGKVKAVLVRAGGAAVQAISKVNAMISAGLGTPFR